MYLDRGCGQGGRGHAVYRHFADLDALFAACTAHWTARNPPPDAAAWPAIRGLEARARRAFDELYGWYRDHAAALYPIYRDMIAMPLSVQREMAATTHRLADTLLAGDVGAETDRDGDERLLRALARHLVDFRTWRSLEIEEGLGAQAAVDLAVRLLTALSQERHRDNGHAPGA
jgi:AcrR family transcriptional regulator